MKISRSFASVAVLLLAATTSLTACKKSELEQKLDHPAAGSTANQDSVVSMLHKSHLIAVPEVKAKSDFYVQQYRSGAMSREQAAHDLRVWIEGWVKSNPDRAKQAEQMVSAPVQGQTAR